MLMHTLLLAQPTINNNTDSIKHSRSLNSGYNDTYWTYVKEFADITQNLPNLVKFDQHANGEGY